MLSTAGVGTGGRARTIRKIVIRGTRRAKGVKLDLLQTDRNMFVLCG